MDLNCLRIVDCITAITGTNVRGKFLRSQLALQLLKINFGLKVKPENAEKVCAALYPSGLCSDYLPFVFCRWEVLKRC